MSVIDTSTDEVTRTIPLAPYAGARVGSNPTGLALTPDQCTLFVSESGNNVVSVIDVATGAQRGLIPTGWYPTGVAATKARLFVANAKGLGAGTSIRPLGERKYITTMMRGSFESWAWAGGPVMEQHAANGAWGASAGGTKWLPRRAMAPGRHAVDPRS